MDANGKTLTEEDLQRIITPQIPVYFFQNELFTTLSKEIFEQQRIWKDVQIKKPDECSKKEIEIKRQKHHLRCSDVLKPLLNLFQIRDQRSPKHSTSYDTCLGKLESMVKEQWDEWNFKKRK